MSNRKGITRVVANCGKCGLCLSACPVYQILKEEQASPRARLQLIKAHENKTLKSSPLLKEIVSKCLMCGACARTCPSGINHYERFMAMRQKMVEDLGETPAIKFLIHILSREYRVRTGAVLGRTVQRLTPDVIADKYKLGNIPVARFPRLNARPFRKTVPKLLPAAPGKQSKGRVLYFTGCATNYMFEDTGRAVIGILARLGYEVVIPRGQTCCAIPMLYHGAAPQARENIQTNIQVLGGHGCDHVIVDCTTCGAALKDEYPAYIAREQASGGSRALVRQAGQIAAKTRDILSFLAEQPLDLDPQASGLGRAVYHAPCHSRNSFDAHDRVRTLLASLPNIDYCQTPEEDQCCGGGGTFFYEHPDIARQMMDRKLGQIRNADLWLTDCPVCRINLAGNLDDSSQVLVRHPAAVILGALRRDNGIQS